jgi:hypothetical protein
VIYVISGQLAAGKSTLARAVLARHEFGYLIDADGVREGVTSGFASPLEPTPETDRQFALAIDAAVALAAVYAPAGFAVAIEGGLDPAEVDAALARAGLLHHRVGVVLLPPLEVALARNAARTTKSHDPALLEPAIRDIDADLRGLTVPEGWTVIDNGDEPVEATVERILALRPGP